MLQTPRALRLAARGLAVAVALSLLPLAVAAQQTTFANPDAAVEALHGALKTNDEARLVELFGEKYRSVVNTGDASYDAARHAQAASALGTRNRLEEAGPDRRILHFGAEDWPFAIPLVREGMSWRFATEQGVEELENRRIGANERQAIYVMRALVDAQRKYAERDRFGDGVLQYARKLTSSPGRHDGLYWPADPVRGEEESPLGPLVAAASKDLASHQEGAPYAGYRFWILTSQGPHAPGGAYKYLINGRMIAGFGVAAAPAEWGHTGIMTFMINQNGKLYQRNLGDEPTAINSFDPGPGWTEVGESP